MAPTLVCPEGRDLYVVQSQAGVPQVWMAVQEGRWPIHSLPEELEDALVCPAGLEAHVL